MIDEVRDTSFLVQNMLWNKSSEKGNAACKNELSFGICHAAELASV